MSSPVSLHRLGVRLRAPWRLVRILICAIALVSAVIATSRSSPLRLLVFARVDNHTTLTATAIDSLRELGRRRDWSVQMTSDPLSFNRPTLQAVDAVVWLDSPNGMRPEQQAAYEEFHRSGKGTIAIHAAATDPAWQDWAWFRQLAPSVRIGTPATRTITVLNYDPKHPATCCVPMMWRHADEWYRFGPNPGPVAHVLLYAWDPEFSNPVAWCREFDGGRYFYTGLGGVASDYQRGSQFLDHLVGGIEWAAGRLGNTVVKVTDGRALILREFDGTMPNGVWDKQPPSPDFGYNITPGALTMTDSSAISLLNRHLVRRGTAIDSRRPYAVEGRFSIPGPIDNKPHSFCVNVNVAGSDGDSGNVSCWSLNVHLLAPGKSLTRFMGFLNGGFAQIGEIDNSWGEAGVEYGFRLYVNADLRGLHQDKLMSLLVTRGEQVLEKFQVDYSPFPYQPDETKPVRLGLNGHGTAWTLKDLRVYYLDITANP